MAIAPRRAVLVGLACAVVGLALVVSRHPFAPARAPGADAGAAKIAIGSGEHRALCTRLAKRYAAQMNDAAQGCRHDDDCVAEERGGIYVQLDGCARFRNKSTSPSGPDSVAAEWLAEACAWAPATNVDCGGASVQCIEARCVERPPAPLPRDWKRLTLPGTLSVFAPPDFVESDSRGEDSLLRIFHGDHRTLEMDLDRYAGPYDTVDAAYGAKLETIDGERAWVYFRDDGASSGPRFEGGMLFRRHFDDFFLGGGYLSMRLSCDDARACAVREAVFGSTRVLAEAVRVVTDD